MNNPVNIPILSLCIPTNGAIKWVVPVIESIYAQNCDEKLFEIIVSDNAKNTELKEYIKVLPHNNIFYQESDAEGFLNIVSSFQSAHGAFCKLINHRALLADESIQKLIDLIQENIEKQPVIYCTNGVLGNDNENVFCKNLDEFVYTLHYYCTWMAGIGIWKKDLPNLECVEYNKLFPNTSILFEQRQGESEYLLWNVRYFEEQNGHGKGCYNLFHTFAVIFPDMLKDLQNRGRITPTTFDKVMKELYVCLQNFYLNFVLRNPDSSFDLTDTHKHITTYYKQTDYLRMMYHCYKEFYWPVLRHKIHIARLIISGKQQ